MAAIDVGSNATRLLIVSVNSCGQQKRRLTQRYAVSLGTDVFSQGRIGAAKRAALLAAFFDIRARLRAAGARSYLAVATSAMRDARNGAAVAQHIARRTGLLLQIISGAEENVLARAALLRCGGSLAPSTLLLDLGGGSLELDRAGALPGCGVSLPIGSVRLLKGLPLLQRPLQGAAFERARQQVGALLAAEVGQVAPAPVAYGTGGNLDALVRLLPSPAAGSLPMLDLPRLLPFVRKAALLSRRARQVAYDLRPDRADLLVPAALIILAVVQRFAVQRLVVPGTGLRDALIYRQLVPPLPAGTVTSTAVARRAAALASCLFHRLAPVHRLHPPALLPLHAALQAWFFGATLQPRQAARLADQFLEGRADLPLDAPARRVARRAVQLASGAARLPRGGAAAVLAGLLRCSLGLAAAGARASRLDVDLTEGPIVVGANLTTPLGAEWTAPLAGALGRALLAR